MALPAGPVAANPLVVAIGGFDPRGASGLLRDFLTIRALGADPYLVPTAFTVQGASGVQRVDLRGTDELRQALTAALTPPTSDVGRGQMTVKIGMVGGAALVPVIVGGLAGFTGAVVYDPVLAASRGGRLYEGDLAALDSLLARADLVTPNLSEATALSGVTVVDLESARAAGRQLLARGARAVLVKGGHMAAGAARRGAADLLVSAGGEEVFSAPRVPGKDPRGTGCALASAIAVGLGRGASLRDAVGEAKRWVHERIVAAARVGDEHWL